MAFSKSTEVHRLPAPKAGEIVHFDEGRPSDRVSGLALRIRAGGSRKFVFFYRLGGRQLKYTIGDATAWTLDAARAEARALRVKVDRGENPATEKAERTEANRLLFSSIVDSYLAVKARSMKPRSLEETTRHLQKYWEPFHRLAVGSITRSMVASRLNSIAKDSGPTAANRGRSSLSAMFSWAIGEGLCETNPTTGTNKAGENEPRDRKLSDAELVAIWKSAPANDYGKIVRLLMLTGQRREEIGNLRWSEVDLDGKLIVLPKERTKNRRAHEVPLSEMAIDVLSQQHRRIGRDVVFGRSGPGSRNWSRAKIDLDEVCGVEGWTLHDLRRTAATRMADLGVAPHIIEAVLNHVSGHKAGVAGIYNRSSYSAEKRAALEVWAGHLKVELAKAEGGNVVKITKAKA